MKIQSSLLFSDDRQGKENQSSRNSATNNKGSLVHRNRTIRTPVKRPPIDQKSAEKRLDPQKLQVYICIYIIALPIAIRIMVIHIHSEMNTCFLNVQLECRVTDQEGAEARTTISDDKVSEDDSPNRISENILKCLTSIFSRIGSVKNRVSAESLPSISTLGTQESNHRTEFRDPYGICSEFGKRDIGPYKQLFSIEVDSNKPNRIANSLFLLRRLK